MSRLILTTAVGQSIIDLKPGLNRLGRESVNDFQIKDPSVSSAHCELIVDDNGILVKDLGSTNGTFINQFQIQEGILRPGQTLQLGNVEMRCEPAGLSFSNSPKDEAIPIPRRMTMPRNQTSTVKGPSPAIPKEEKGFFAQLPEAFAYPFHKDGWLLLVAGTLFFAFLSFLSRVTLLLSLPIAIFSGGYLASYLQAIITSTAQGEHDLPKWPDFSDFIQDIVVPFFQILSTILFCFGPAIVVPIFLGESALWRIVLLVLGALYFPMALTAVSIAQSLSGLNPALIVASILKVAPQYFVTCVILGAVFGVHMASDVFVPMITGNIPIITHIVTGFVSLYFLTVEMRILGLLYYTNRDQLGWI